MATDAPTAGGPTAAQLILAIVPKFSAAASLLGSSMIVSQVLQSKKNRSNSQQRIVLTMSCMDFMVSTVWLMTDLLVPPWSQDYYYALGNQGTCDFQGFIVQLSIGGVLTNASLAIYYVLVIKSGWKMRDIAKIEPYLLAVPLVWGLGTAVAGLVLNLYNPASWDCWIAAHPPGCTQSHEIDAMDGDTITECERGDNADIFQWVFFFGPLWLTIGVVTCCMITVVSSFGRVERKSNKWIRRGSNQARMQHTKQIAAQSYLYVGAFYVTWFWPTVARIVQLCNLPIPTWLVTTAGCFIPLQGFFNGWVYFRPRFINCSGENQDRSKWWIMRKIVFVSLCCCFNSDRHNRKDGNDIEGISDESTDSHPTEESHTMMDESARSSTIVSSLFMDENQGKTPSGTKTAVSFGTVHKMRTIPSQGVMALNETDDSRQESDEA